METAQIQGLERLDMPTLISSHPQLGVEYTSQPYSIPYPLTLTRTLKNYHISKAGIPAGYRMSAAGEELHMQLQYEILSRILNRVKDKREIREIAGKNPDEIKQALQSYARNDRERTAIQYVLDMEGKIVTDPREAKVFNDLFARNPENMDGMQWTETFLRVPKGKRNPEKPDYIDPKTGDKYWIREIGNGSEISGIVHVPEGNWRVVPYSEDPEDVFDLIWGIPRVTSDSKNDSELKNHTTHFRFAPNPYKDNNSGHYDVAVTRGSDVRRGVHGGCLDLGAGYVRSDAYSGVGFRLVQGSLPEIEKKITRLNLTEVEEAFLERMRKDAREMPLHQFLEKYNL